MPRKDITPLYDETGRYRGDLTDTWGTEEFVDARDGRRHQVQDPAPGRRSLQTSQPPARRSLRTTQAPPPRPQTPQDRLRTMSDAERRQIALQALTVGVPKPPNTLDGLAAAAKPKPTVRALRRENTRSNQLSREEASSGKVVMKDRVFSISWVRFLEACFGFCSICKTTGQ